MECHFLVFDGVEELDLVGPWQLVGLLADRGHCPLPKLVTLNSRTAVAEYGMRFVAHLHFAESPAPDVLFIPGGSGAREAMADADVIEFVQTRARSCRAVLSICTGSYLMQKAGLLEGRRATTHWAFREHLESDPGVSVVEEPFVRDGPIWSSGGVSSGIDMTLAFIADELGENAAADVQLDAEYFPSGRLYGRPFDRSDVSAYIRRLTAS